MKKINIAALSLVSLALALNSCSREQMIPIPMSKTSAMADEVRVHFRVSTPSPMQPGTRAVDPEYAVNKIALLVFRQNNGEGPFLFQYTAESSILGQADAEDDFEVDFEATLRTSNDSLRLLVAVNYPDGLFDAIPTLAAEAEVREALSDDTRASYSDTGFPMTGLEEMASLSASPGVIRIPVQRSVAKVTVDKALNEDSPDFTVNEVAIFHMNDSFQFFPNAASVDNEEDAPLPVAPSIPAGAVNVLHSSSSLDSSESYLGYLSESAANADPAAAACLVVGGIFEGDDEETYYRIDFGEEGDAVHPIGQVLRNFWYRFTIVEVTSSGWATPEDAANNPATGLQATVVPWNGGDNNNYYFGKNQYIVLSADTMMLDAIVGRTDSLVITTSEVPFTIASERRDAVGMLDTADPSRTIETDIMTYTLTSLPAAAGQQKWLLEVTAKTGTSTQDYVNLYAAHGLLTIRIFVQRNPPPDPTTRTIRVYSAGTGIGSMNYGANEVTDMLSDTRFFGPVDAVIPCAGFTFDYSTLPATVPQGAELEALLENVDVFVMSWTYNPREADCTIIEQWLSEPGHVALVMRDDTNTNEYFCTGFGNGLTWYDNAANFDDYVDGYTGVLPAAPSPQNAPFLDGPFGTVDPLAVDDATPYDATSQFAEISTPTNPTVHIVPLVVPTGTAGRDENFMLLGVDTGNNIIYCGEAQLNNTTYGMATSDPYDSGNYFNRLWANIWAWAVNAVIYGD